MAPFWFWNPAYIGTVMKLFSVYVIWRNLPMAFVSPRTKVKSWPGVCICLSLPVCSAQGPWSNTEISLLMGVCLVCHRLSRHSLCHGCSVPGNPAEFPALGATPAVPLSLLWSLQGKVAPFCGTTASLPFLLFNFPKCLCANTTGILFQPDKKWLFLLQCVHFPWVRNCDLYIHLFIPVMLLYFWTGMSANPEEG